MSILVTGGAGFIGSSLMDRLAARGDDLVCWDDFNDYYDPRIKRANIAPLIEQRKARLYEGDICDTALGAEIFRRERIDTIVHLAARAGVRPSLRDPLLYERTNGLGTTHLLELARKNGVKKFVFASSSSVYGNNAKVPFAESDPVDMPISPYAATKRAGELMCHVFHEIYGLAVVCLRFFNAYGPRGRPDSAMYIFTEKMERGEEIEMFGDGSVKRDYTYIDDILNGVVAAIDLDFRYEIINLGESKTTELRRFIELIAAATGKTPRIKRLPPQPGDVRLTCADISKSQRLLGYNPGFPLERGIPLFVEWYRKTVARS